MKKLSIITLGLIVIFLFSCNENSDSMLESVTSSAGFPQSKISEDGANTATQDPAEKPDASKVAHPRKLIREGTISFQSADFEGAQSLIHKAATATEAFISREEESHSQYRNELSYTLRVPAANFDNLLNQIMQGLGKPESKNIQVSDVTLQYYDLESRLASQQVILDRYRTLLGRAQSIKDILAIEEKIGGIETEIKSIGDRLAVLKDQVSLSTLHITIWDTPPVKSQTGWGRKFSNAFANGWNYFISFWVVVVSAWPFWIILGVLIVIFRKVSRRSGKK